MTIVLKRFCAHQGCNALVVEGYCPNHKAPDYRTQEETKFYRSNRWRLLSERHRREEPLCRECAKVNKLTVATCVDHIIPIRQGGDPYNEDGLQSLCDACHARKRASERHTAK